MKRTLSFILIAVSSMVFKTSVLALDVSCTQTEQIRLRQLANATQISYEFRKDNDGTYGFDVKITGFSSDFYIYDETNGTAFEYDGNSTVTRTDFTPGIAYQLPFYASDTGICKGYLILTKTVSLPNYNIYSEDPLCKDIETYELCKKFTPIQINSYSDFQNRVKQYIKSMSDKKNENTITEVPTPVEQTIIQKIGDFFANNYMIMLIVIIISGTAGIIKIEVERRKSIL